MGKNVRALAEEIVGREGGYVNDPDDPGGATNFGVTIHTMRRLGLDLDGDGQITAEDVKLLSKDQAIDIFLEHYYAKPGISLLPEVIQASVFDMYVNAGGHAARILQRLLVDMGFEISVDGAIGPITASAAHKAAEKAPSAFADAYGIARRNYYFRIADRRPASRKYARTRAGGKGGWIKRAEEFISPQFHLSATEFDARVASWG